MKKLTLLSIASLLLVAGCASSPEESVDSREQRAAAASSMHHYRCESGTTIAAAYPDSDSATVQYQDERYPMRIAVSASGARYVGGGLEWWTKGSGAGAEGMLVRHQEDGTSGEILERCTAR
ncbi:MliC family protein [Halomonas sp. KAO]|uniref:MliC family protein n=1 Tax=Halomonas sp. KAO TaxID=2783858 RepID=UPI00189E7370|nr:MliC family protein [Halomonas sp. KAO]MBF7053097.1 MliC family protein [Halomonas sp. KAO]